MLQVPWLPLVQRPLAQREARTQSLTADHTNSGEKQGMNVRHTGSAVGKSGRQRRTMLTLECCEFQAKKMVRMGLAVVGGFAPRSALKGACWAV